MTTLIEPATIDTLYLLAGKVYPPTIVPESMRHLPPIDSLTIQPDPTLLLWWRNIDQTTVLICLS
jgi:hypothetical protein